MRKLRVATLLAILPVTLAATFALLAGVASASAQSYPTHQIAVVVPASAGGPTDTIARIVMARAQQILG